MGQSWREKEAGGNKRRGPGGGSQVRGFPCLELGGHPFRPVGQEGAVNLGKLGWHKGSSLWGPVVDVGGQREASSCHFLRPSLWPFNGILGRFLFYSLPKRCVAKWSKAPKATWRSVSAGHREAFFYPRALYLKVASQALPSCALLTPRMHLGMTGHVQCLR